MAIEAAVIQYRQAFVDQFEGKASVFRTMATKESVIKGNMMGLFTTKCLDLTGGADNIVTGNYFSGDYSTASGAYVAGTTDGWFGNFATDVAEAEVDPNGLTTAVPAA